MRFCKKANKQKNGSVRVTIPIEIVGAYNIHDDDLLEFDLVKNHRDDGG